jgi:hypothetical protein
LPDLLQQLGIELAKGITTEVQVVYLMVGIRKILEQRSAKDRYEYLTFYCDWALHSKLEGRMAQRILKLFDSVNIHTKTGMDPDGLPSQLKRQVDRISKIHSFRESFSPLSTVTAFLRSQKGRESVGLNSSINTAAW